MGNSANNKKNLQAGTLAVPIAPLQMASTGTHGQDTTTGRNFFKRQKMREIAPQLEKDCDEASTPSARAY